METSISTDLQFDLAFSESSGFHGLPLFRLLKLPKRDSIFGQACVGHFSLGPSHGSASSSTEEDCSKTGNFNGNDLLKRTEFILLVS